MNILIKLLIIRKPIRSQHIKHELKKIGVHHDIVNITKKSDIEKIVDFF